MATHSIDPAYFPSSATRVPRAGTLSYPTWANGGALTAMFGDQQQNWSQIGVHRLQGAVGFAIRHSTSPGLVTKLALTRPEASQILDVLQSVTTEHGRASLRRDHADGTWFSLDLMRFREGGSPTGREWVTLTLAQSDDAELNSATLPLVEAARLIKLLTSAITAVFGASNDELPLAA